MYITAAMMIDKLAIDLVKSRIRPESINQYHSVRFLLPNQKRLDEQEIYVTDQHRLSMVEYINPNCLLICSSDKAIDADCSVLVSQEGLENTFATAAAAVDAYQMLDSRLKDALLAEKGLDGLLEICAGFFQNMAQVLDPAFNVIAGTTPVVDAASGEIIAYHKDVSSFSASTLDEMSRSNLLQETYGSQTAQFHKSPIFEYRAIISNLVHEDQYLGKLLIIENTSMLGQGAIDVVNQIVPFFNHLMQKRSAELNVTLQTVEHFISETLKGNIRDSSFISAQLARMDWRMDDRFVILALQMRSRILADFYVQIIRNHFESAVAFPDQECVVAVIRLSASGLDEAERSIQAVLDQTGLKCGISEVFTSFIPAKDHYIQARYALDAAIRLQSAGSLHRYRDQAINHLYLLASQAEHSRAFVHPAVAAIVQYDQVNQTEYFKTLVVYFESNFNQVLTASRLHIHRKSLQYRLSRLTKIAPVDLSDPEEQIRLMLSLRFYENEQLIAMPRRAASDQALEKDQPS